MRCSRGWAVTGVDDHRIALIARFWAAVTMTVHGTFWAILFYAHLRSQSEFSSPPALWR